MSSTSHTFTNSFLLFSGQAGTYFGTEYEGLPADVHSSLHEVGQLLLSQGLAYLGKLTCSQFSQIEVYAYATPDQRIAVSVMATESGLSGIDCVSKFLDESFLTTTTVQVLHNAYDEQKLFRLSFPGFNAIELLAQHLTFVQDFEQRCGAAQAIFVDLLAIAQMVDEYTTRQESNVGHGWCQFAGGFAQASVARMMGDDADEADEDDEDNDDDDEELDDDRIEYDEDNVSPLIRAILQDDLAQVERLLEAGAELNPSSWDTEVPLVAAVYQGDPMMIQTLIAAGANLDKLDFSVDARPLGMAIKQDRPDLVKQLLNAGASPEGGDLSWTGLTVAIEKNNLPILQMLLEAGADPNTGMEDDDRAIMHAVWHGNLDMVKLLITNGADINAWSQGDTAIMSAARNAHQAVYEYLYPLVDEETRRHADKHGQKDIAKAIKRKAREANKLAEKLGDAALFGKLTKVQQLLAEGTDPNAITECGKSPLMLAAMYGHTSVIDALLEAGADPNLGSDEEFEEGTTALMYIASSFFASNRAEVIRFLVERGGNVNAQNDKGQTALIMAGSNTDAVKALIEAGADVNLRDNEDNTAMMLGNWAIQQLLRKAGASEEGLNDVALVDAAYTGDLTKLEELLQSGANVNYKDGNALVAAAGKGNLAIVDRLLQAGANVNLGWKTGATRSLRHPMQAI
ncbi:ankyrin repeat domain-containing protein [Phormidium sp. FACHB-592]|uniref:Ankyrin repeat domain-containing protein n=1 Tax=Stenomitos frigidus AS-A4 TaxID=2933935 RepID=A0ABV0KQR6_9CYAN|nr:ankyrin repeat domain-containing protein [Phormidium sp. FACHB-592]MBD2072923.1 ankyrin repeat domain-containing protein [Phormidium sp. FACHB-592]